MQWSKSLLHLCWNPNNISSSTFPARAGTRSGANTDPQTPGVPVALEYCQDVNPGPELQNRNIPAASREALGINSLPGTSRSKPIASSTLCSILWMLLLCITCLWTCSLSSPLFHVSQPCRVGSHRSYYKVVSYCYCCLKIESNYPHSGEKRLVWQGSFSFMPRLWMGESPWQVPGQSHLKAVLGFLMILKTLEEKG